MNLAAGPEPIPGGRAKLSWSAPDMARPGLPTQTAFAGPRPGFYEERASKGCPAVEGLPALPAAGSRATPPNLAACLLPHVHTAPRLSRHRRLVLRLAPAADGPGGEGRGLRGACDHPGGPPRPGDSGRGLRAAPGGSEARQHPAGPPAGQCRGGAHALPPHPPGAGPPCRAAGGGDRRAGVDRAQASRRQRPHRARRGVPVRPRPGTNTASR